MAGRILLPGVQQGPDVMAKDINRVVKEHLGRSRPFMFIVINDTGDAMVLSNMDVHEQRCQLLDQTLKRFRSTT